RQIQQREQFCDEFLVCCLHPSHGCGTVHGGDETDRHRFAMSQVELGDWFNCMRKRVAEIEQCTPPRFTLIFSHDRGLDLHAAFDQRFQHVQIKIVDCSSV